MPGPHTFDSLALRLLALPLLLVLGAALACSDSSGTAEVGGTGTISLFVTDAPSDAFDEILVTITEIELSGGGPKVKIFEGRTTIDLKSLESFSDLLVVAEDVPARTYSKIRLKVAAIELVDYDGDPEVISVDPPGGGKIDLNPRGPFEVRPGGHLVIEIDMDAEKSIHIHETGNGKYKFRPVVFVTIGEGLAPRKLVRLHGFVSVWIADDSFRLCPTVPVHRISTASGEESTDAGSGRPSGFTFRDPCFLVEFDDRTGVFDTNGDPRSIEELGSAWGGIPTTPIGAIDDSWSGGYVSYDTTGEVTVIGHFDFDPDLDDDAWSEYRDRFWNDSDAPRTSDAPHPIVRAAVIEEGPLGTFLQLGGWLEPHDEDPDDVLRFLPAPGQGFGDSTWLPALLQDGTRIFDRTGVELSADEIDDDFAAEVDGVFGAVDESGRLFYKTALVVAGAPFFGSPYSGTSDGRVTHVDPSSRLIQMNLGEVPGFSVVPVPEGVEVQFVYDDDDGSVNIFGPLAALAPGTEVAVSIANSISGPGFGPSPADGIVAYGPPSPNPPCTGDDDCAAGEYCHRPDDHCDWGGVCEPRPQACTQQFDPVCGCDGTVHPNACAAASAGTSLQPDREVCSPAD